MEEEQTPKDEGVSPDGTSQQFYLPEFLKNEI